MCEVCPCKYLSVGGSTGPSVGGAVGVGQREKGFEEGVSAPPLRLVELMNVEVFDSVELCRDLAKLLRRKGKGGRR